MRKKPYIPFITFAMLRPHTEPGAESVAASILDAENALMFGGWSKAQAQAETRNAPVSKVQPPAPEPTKRDPATWERAQMKKQAERALRTDGFSRKQATTIAAAMHRTSDDAR
jgi:hypothetical protein